MDGTATITVVRAQNLGEWPPIVVSTRQRHITAFEIIETIVGVSRIWVTRSAGVKPLWSDSPELSSAAKARGVVRAGERVVAELTEWLEDEVGAVVQWPLGTPKIKLPRQVS